MTSTEGLFLVSLHLEFITEKTLGRCIRCWNAKNKRNNCLSNAFDRLSNHFGFCLCVCVYVCLSADRLSNDYVRNSLPIFTKC